MFPDIGTALKQAFFLFLAIGIGFGVLLGFAIPYVWNHLSFTWN